MRNISLGRYLPNNTFIHRLDPRLKFISLIIMMSMVFFRFPSVGMNFIYYGILFIVLLILMMISKIRIKIAV
jgi:energy-coupling factor transport system permease protein